MFGIKKSNRDFSIPETWGKNQFNSSFPTALACYLYAKNLNAKYIICSNGLDTQVKSIAIDKLFNINPLGDDVFYSFETPFLPYQKYVVGSIPRNDLVIQNLRNNLSVASLEIKLTALPDNSTCLLNPNQFGCEIVVRPDTIIYLACSIIKIYEKMSFNNLCKIILPIGDQIRDWTNGRSIIPYLNDINNSIRTIVHEQIDFQSPIILEPIWKTEGKSSKLAQNCLDVFVWSNFAMLNLFMPPLNSSLESISRHTRSMVWLYKMLYDFCKNEQFNGRLIIDELSYNTKNDKAFSTSGIRTYQFMNCQELMFPRVEKKEIRNIILGGGQNLLSPERRFDAIIYNSPDLFEEIIDESC